MPKRLKETMIRSDFHMHTAFSTDSEEAVESMLNRAVERGLYSVCITDHMDADYPPDDELGESAFRLDTENYFPFLLKKKKEYEERIQVRIGIELGLQKHLGTRIRDVDREVSVRFCDRLYASCLWGRPLYRKGV